MIPHLFIVLFISATFISHVVLHAGSAQEGEKTQAMTMAGCLQTGVNAGEFVLVNDEKTTYQVHPAEGVEVAAHVNHRVELTGTIETTESGTIFKATALKMVSTACEHGA